MPTDRFYELVEMAKEGLDGASLMNSNIALKQARFLRGIGYAILALAKAVNDVAGAAEKISVAQLKQAEATMNIAHSIYEKKSI